MPFNSTSLPSFGSLLTFHHVGVACRDIDREYDSYKLLGYEKIGKPFEDAEQGIRGLFISKSGNGGSMLELLENLHDSSTLNFWLEHKTKLYHLAYTTPEIKVVQERLIDTGAKLDPPLKISKYFSINVLRVGAERRICFLALRNMQLIELIESDYGN